MAAEPSLETRLRAELLAQREMLRQLWVYVLAATSEPRGEAAACREVGVAAFEAMLAKLAPAQENELVNALAIDAMERMWRLIDAELASHEESIDVAVVPPDRVPPAKSQDRKRRSDDGAEPDL